MLHVTFTPSGAGFLRQALRQMGLRQRVLAFPDDLSFGPIDPDDGELRRVWEEANLRPPDERLRPPLDLPRLPGIWEGWRSMAEETEEFWTSALGADACTVWFTRRIPSEYCGFLAWVERAGSKPYSVVDMTDLKSGVDRVPGFSLDFADPSKVDLRSAVRGAAPLSLKLCEDYLRQWKALRRENAALRVILNRDLVSAPIDVFDDLLLSRVPPHWRKAMWVAAETTALALWDDYAKQGNIQVLMARLYALLEAGWIECKGDLSEWWESCEIRLPERERASGAQKS